DYYCLSYDNSLNGDVF
nr:immunoglobulin light chain junction region [Macaca mulatta]MOW06742.1 immunoglobulin light chain junction region [Macaca mulatta]MOW07283.1 immunoglobulin light chain junction region [Macaca mulatta]